MMFFIVDNGDDPWIGVLIAGLFEIPCLLLVSVAVKFGPRKVLYLIIYVTSGLSAAVLVFTNKGEFVLIGLSSPEPRRKVQAAMHRVSVSHTRMCFSSEHRDLGKYIEYRNCRSNNASSDFRHDLENGRSTALPHPDGSRE